jgi:hypothetical protein
MKTKCILIALCLICTSIGFAQNKLFDKYADMDDVTSVYISKAMFQMISGKTKIDKVGLNVTNMKDKIESFQLVTTEKPDKITQMKKEFSQLVTAQHQELMRVKSEDSRVRFFSNMQGDLIKELIMLVEADDNFTAILLIGSFTLKDIQEIADRD